MNDLTSGVKREARRLGFDLVGIAAPRPSVHLARYRDWLERGYHGDMSYLARPDSVAKRADPRIVMPEVRSIVLVGMAYYPGDFASAEVWHGRVSRYAWGLDYHDVMMEKLDDLAGWLEAEVRHAVTHRPYVDFGPLMERELAQRAGLGWFGKNTNLIHPDLGSYFFLGELLVDVHLEEDASFDDDRCGSCTACLDACPTGALAAPRVLDARRCISYLTIEHRDAIPEELRPKMSDWVFGCDVCQEVCPWNKRFASPVHQSVFRPKRSLLDLRKVLELDEAGFRSRFRNTPLWRPRRPGLLRNAAVVLGNSRAPAAIPALRGAVSDESSFVAEHAAWALERLRDG